jgi:hypothetical protein
MSYKEHYWRYDCKACGQTDTFSCTDLECAFEEVFPRSFSCTLCGSKNIVPMGRSIPKFTLEIMEIWSMNKHRTFLEQEEDILLAEKEYLPFLEQFLIEAKTLDCKKKTIVLALADQLEEPYREEVVKILLRHKDLITQNLEYLGPGDEEEVLDILSDSE